MTTWQVGTSSDDTSSSDGDWRIDWSGLYITNLWGAVNEIGVRFTNITISKGATITSAYLTLQATANYVTGDSTIIRGIAEDNTATFSTYVNFAGRARTNSSASWTFEAWTQNSSYNSPDLTSIIQEIINRAGWASGNALAIVTSPGTSVTQYRQAKAYDVGAAYAPQLTVTWVAVGIKKIYGDGLIWIMQ